MIGKDDELPGRLQDAADLLEEITPLLGREVVIVKHVDQKNQVDRLRSQRDIARAIGFEWADIADAAYFGAIPQAPQSKRRKAFRSLSTK